MYDRIGKKYIQNFDLLYGQATSMDKSIFRNTVGCYHNRNPLLAFSGDDVIFKVLKKLSPMEPLFN